MTSVPVKYASVVAAMLAVTTISACSSSAPDPDAVAKAGAVIVTPNDITDRHYVVLGDIDVAVKRWATKEVDPTWQDVAEALREKAADMGADAVILTRIGKLQSGVVKLEMDGEGRAVAFR